MPTYDPKTIAANADPAVIAGFRKAAVSLHASSKVTLALFEAGIVEANLKNPAGGDRDSVGSLQQRSQGWGTLAERMDPYQAALKFVEKANRLENRFATAGQLAQAVQVSAFPLRYDQAKGAAEYVLQAKEGTVTTPGKAIGDATNAVGSTVGNAVGAVADAINPFDNIKSFLESLGMRLLYFVSGLGLLLLGGIILTKGGSIASAASAVGVGAKKAKVSPVTHKVTGGRYGTDPFIAKAQAVAK